jgi:Ca-activated chloride channel family protein
MGHKTVSFDGGTLNIQALNNGEGWDAMFFFYPDGATKSAASKRTYGDVKAVELNPGTYDIVVKAMKLKGTDIEQRVEDIVVEGNTAKAFTHNFSSGTLLIGAKSGATLVDATVNIYDKNTGKNVAGGRTYTAATSNPKKFQLTPGTYEVEVKALGDFKGKTAKFTVTVEAGKTLEKVENF